MHTLPVLGEEVPLYCGTMEVDLQKVARNKLAERITGGLSKTQKMPTYSWGIPATRCRIGSILAQQEGTTCSECYALRGRYKFPNVKRKGEEHYEGMKHELWTPSMTFLINYFCERYFRWFDSGDLQGVNHLKNIVTIAEHTPDIQHWLPTREAQTVKEVGSFPENLVVRVSAAMIDGKPPRGFPHTSTVLSEAKEGDWFGCPAANQGNSCGDCRACFDPEIPKVAYTLH